MNSWQRLSRVWLLAAALLPLAGCAGLSGRTEPVSVNVADLRMGAAGVFEQQYFVSLRIQNPNDRELNVDGVVFELEINDKSFARGTSGQSLTIPRFGSGVVEIETVSTLTGILRQLGGMTRDGDPAKAFKYRIKGRLHQAGIGGSVPFDDRGEINLTGSTGEGKNPRAMRQRMHCFR